ncbi:MAG TPA: glycoside hydrolase family 16 protein [Chitinophagaceae bacterium]|nr:glycoside hydrolase family 16 protein [Chitinophagaceae bacterium]HMU58927.1 glycoside hydrolase family 16 protein [Chitinophagaceae bacterium]
MKQLLILILTAFILQSAKSQSNQWSLIWQDEFNYNGLPDSTKWVFDTKGNAHGWGNNEKQHYTAYNTGNAVVEKGSLKIIARKQKTDKRDYTSARLITKGRASFQYGKIIARIKLPGGKGVWPAFWMLGNNIDSVDWPRCGEIDIMEHVGYEPDSIYGTIHSNAYNHMKGTQKVKAIAIKKPYTRFHKYSIEWTPEKIDFFVDGKKLNSIDNEYLTDKEWPFNQPFYIILNLAVGGNWGGKHGIDDAVFPSTMEVDYVRVYQKK